VARGCFTCNRSRALAERVRERFPAVVVRVIDLTSEEGEHGDLVAATPTFVLNGRVLSLGNPSEGELEAAISALHNGEGP
jgi:hypothetical protein